MSSQIRIRQSLIRPAPMGHPMWGFALLAAVAGCGGPDGVANDSSGVTGANSVPGVAGLGANDGLIGPDDEIPIAGTCASSVATETFTSALCSCEDTRVAGYLRTRSFRSSDGPDAPEQLGGSVSVNQDYRATGYADVGGSFAVAGIRDVLFGGYLKTGDDLRFSPSFNVGGVVDVGRDAWLKNTVRALGRVEIGRDLYMPAGAAFTGIAFVDVAGAEHTVNVDIEAPCACAPEQIIDVPALVDAARDDNDNALVGLDSGDFNLVVGIGSDLTLPGGRYYIDQLGSLGSLTLHVTGKTALFIADDLLTTGAFRIDLEPNAEIDIFVRDNLIVTGAAAFGDFRRPSATRIYVGGTGDVAIAGATAFVGNLYAPTANVLVGGAGRVQGSLFGKNIFAAGYLSVGYDSSITEPRQDCPPVGEADIPRIR